MIQFDKHIFSNGLVQPPTCKFRVCFRLSDQKPRGHLFIYLICCVFMDDKLPVISHCKGSEVNQPGFFFVNHVANHWLRGIEVFHFPCMACES